MKDVVTYNNKTEEKKLPEVVDPKTNVSIHSESESEPTELAGASGGCVDKVTNVAMATKSGENVTNKASARISEITIDSTTDDDRSETSSVSAASTATVSTTTAERVSKSSKSWAEMAEDESSVDVDEILEFEDSDVEKRSSTSEVDQKDGNAVAKQEDKRSRKNRKVMSPEERKQMRESRKVEVVKHDDECFD